VHPFTRSPQSPVHPFTRSPVNPQVPLAILELQIGVVDQLYVELEAAVSRRGLVEAEVRSPAVQVAAEVQRVAGELVVRDRVGRPPVCRPAWRERNAGRQVAGLDRAIVAQPLGVVGAGGTGERIVDARAPLSRAESLGVAAGGARSRGLRGLGPLGARDR